MKEKKENKNVFLNLKNVSLNLENKLYFLTLKNIKIFMKQKKQKCL